MEWLDVISNIAVWAPEKVGGGYGGGIYVESYTNVAWLDYAATTHSYWKSRTTA